MNLQLRRPSLDLEAPYLRAFHQLSLDADRRDWIYMGDSAPLDIPIRDFEGYVQALLRREQESPPGFVRDTAYWAINGGEMQGRISIRHELNDFLRRVGGHIGYIVHPNCRGRGVATEMLKQALLTERARRIGRLLLTCDEDNVASERVIVKSGGVFDRIVDLGPARPKKKHYWIKLHD